MEEICNLFGNPLPFNPIQNQIISKWRRGKSPVMHLVPPMLIKSVSLNMWRQVNFFKVLLAAKWNLTKAVVMESEAQVPESHMVAGGGNGNAAKRPLDCSVSTAWCNSRGWVSASSSDLLYCAKASLFGLLNLVCVHEHLEPIACENQLNPLLCTLCEAATSFWHDKVTRRFALSDPMHTDVLMWEHNTNFS